MMFKVIEKNNDFIVVVKPANIGFHDYDDNSGFFNMVRDTLKMELYPVHRLDRVTSGIIIFARSREAANKLAEQFKMRGVEKYYLALSDRQPSRKSGEVCGGIERSPSGQWMLTKKSFNFSKTLFLSQKLSNNLVLFVVKPLTGKTNQIRVALKSLGSPIMGDPLYSSSSNKYDRTYLHAWAISFRFRGRRYSFTQLPETGDFFTDDAFKAAINSETKPESFGFFAKR